MNTVFASLLFVLPFTYGISDYDLTPPCFSEIYCHGPLLHTVQMARLYQDSKTFVDMKLKYPPNETLEIFDQFMIKYNNHPTKQNVREFVAQNFEAEGQEFENWDPSDWVEHPKFVDRIKDAKFKKWALELNAIWKTLGRKMKEDVRTNNELYSIIWVPNPVIVPGGRFREFYYWDSYWIILGLLLSEMNHTAKGMLENFLYIVSTVGHIPNGGRIYYLARSQPPFLIPMIKQYFDKTNDIQFIEKHLDTMEKEFNFWMENHTVVVPMNGKNYTMGVYGDKSYGPRPESYSEDVIPVQHLNEEKKEEFYAELKAAAESGWDFSSRWFITNGTNEGNLTNIKTRSIVPVDLNAFLYWNAVLLAEFNELVGNKEKSDYYTTIAKEWLDAVEAVLWHDEVGVWLDYDLSNNVKRDYFYPTNIAPLWTGCYNASKIEKISRLAVKYLHNKHIMNNPGGVPSTIKHTGEQWDYPNAWPPLQHLMVVALNNTGDKVAQRLAFEIAEKWVRSNYVTYIQENAMMEKYDVTVVGAKGSGGEYMVQEGFGWTNGVILNLLDKYGDQLFVDNPAALTVEARVPNKAKTVFSSVTTVLTALLISLTAGFIGIFIYKRRTRQQISNAQQNRLSKVKYTELKNFPRQER